MVGAFFAVISTVSFGFHNVAMRRGVLGAAAVQALYVTVILGVPVLLSELCPDSLGATVPELLEVAPEGSRMRKVFFSCADQNECLLRIDALARRQVVVAGMEGHVCVMQSAQGLAERGFETFIV